MIGRKYSRKITGLMRILISSSNALINSKFIPGTYLVVSCPAPLPSHVTLFKFARYSGRPIMRNRYTRLLPSALVSILRLSDAGIFLERGRWKTQRDLKYRQEVGGEGRVRGGDG